MSTDTLRRQRPPITLPSVHSPGLVHACLRLAVCAVPVLLYLPFLNEPFMRDEGFYASVARAMDHGLVPYEDAFDNKPPMIFVWYYTSFAIFGDNVLAPRLLAALLLTGATQLVYLHARILFDHAGRALIAAAAFGLSFSVAVLETNANTEFFMLPFLVATGLFFTLGQRTGGPACYFAAGVAGGISMMTKQTAVFPVGFLILWSLTSGIRIGGLRAIFGTRALRTGWLMAFGALCAGLAVAAPFVVAGALPDMAHALLIYTLEYSGETSALRRLTEFAHGLLFLFMVAGPWVFLAIIGAVVAVRSRHPEATFLIGWAVSGWLGLFAAGRFYTHYYVALIPAAALLIPLAVYWIAENWKQPYVRAALAPALVFLAGLALIASGSIYLRDSADARHLAKYDDPGYPAREVDSDELAAWVRENTSAGDKIYNIGFHSELYFLADRLSPTRYMFDHPFIVDRGYIDDAIAELEADPPVLVLDTAIHEYDLDDHGRPITETGESPHKWDVYPGQPIREWVRANYDFLGQYWYADVYVLPQPHD